MWYFITDRKKPPAEPKGGGEQRQAVKVESEMTSDHTGDMVTITCVRGAGVIKRHVTGWVAAEAARIIVAVPGHKGDTVVIRRPSGSHSGF